MLADQYVVIEKTIGWDGEMVHTKRIGVFSTRREAENCIRVLNARPSQEEGCYSIYWIEWKA